MAIIQPVDYIEAISATKYLLKHKGPVYLRLGRSKLPVINKKSYQFEFGKGIILRDGKDVAIIATGSLVHEALKAHDELKKNKISAKVINIHTIKPIDKGLITRTAKEIKAIVTAEDHNIIGGLGSAVAETLAEHYPVPTEFIGVKDIFAESAKAADLYEKYGLTYNHIIKAVKKVLKRK